MFNLTIQCCTIDIEDSNHNFTGTKILEEPQLIISSEKSGGTSFLRIVNSDNIYVEQQPLPKLVDTVRFTTVNQTFQEEEIEKSSLKKEEEKSADSDRESLRYFKHFNVSFIVVLYKII